MPGINNSTLGKAQERCQYCPPVPFTTLPTAQGPDVSRILIALSLTMLDLLLKQY